MRHCPGQSLSLSGPPLDEVQYLHMSRRCTLLLGRCCLPFEAAWQGVKITDVMPGFRVKAQCFTEFLMAIQFGWKSLNGANCIVVMVVGFRVYESFAECVPNEEILFCKVIEMGSKLLPPVAKDKVYKTSSF